jgi:tetratricopeptide (TPR) repeat protein
MTRDKWIAALVLGIVLGAGAIFVYGRVAGDSAPGDFEVRTGNYRLEDGLYEQAIGEFEKALVENPEHTGAHLGLALTLLQMGRLEEAITRFDRVLALDPEMAVAYADRGIAWDRLGEHEKALADYRAALALDDKLTKGPGWLWRFLRNVHEPPPTIADRADYLEAELAKPLEERLLQLPEEDSKQRMYKID